MRVTHKVTDLLADAMRNNPDRKHALLSDGRFGTYVNGEFKALVVFTIPEDDSGRLTELWSGSVALLMGNEPKLKYKKYLEEYLYKALGMVIANRHREVLKLTGVKEIDDIIMSEKYQRYLRNERIELEECVIGHDRIMIAGGSTSFANHRLQRKYDLQEILDLHEEVRQLVIRDERAKVHRPYKYVNSVNNLYSKYEEEYWQYNRDFNALCSLWSYKMGAGGMRVGYRDDDVYQEIILPVEFRIQAYGRSEATRTINNIVRSLKSTLESYRDERITKYEVTL